MQLLIDGDILAYRFSFANEFVIDWDEEVKSEVTILEKDSGY